MRSALRPRVEVMDIEETVVSATGDDAALVVAPEHGAAGCRWNGLAGARAGRHRGPHVRARLVLVRTSARPRRWPGQVLRVARGHFADHVVHPMALASGVDLRAAAVIASGNGDLVAGVTVVGRASERAPGDLVKERVVIDVAAEVRSDAALEIPEQGPRFGAHIESEPMFDERWIGAVLRPLARLPRRHGLFDFVNAAVLGKVAPGLFGLRRGDAGELADGGPGELSGGKGAVEARQRGKGAANAESFLRLTTVEADDPFSVLAKAAVSGTGVHGEPFGSEQPSAEVALLGRTLATDSDEALVDVGPMRGRLGFRHHLRRLRSISVSVLAKDEQRKRSRLPIFNDPRRRYHSLLIAQKYATSRIVRTNEIIMARRSRRV